MKTSILSLAVALTAAGPAFAVEGDEQSPDTIVVTAPRLTATVTATEADEELSTGPDGAAFIARQPGAALVANGALSGQVQMRGLFGERILLRINGQRFATGGPNAMDPAMHYAPMMLIDRIEIARGISPVRDGPGLGGGVNTILKHARFGNGSGLSPQIDLTSQYRSVDDSIAVGGLVALASDSLRLGVIGSYETGDDIRFPGGRIGSTSFHRAVYGVQAGLRAGPGEFSLEYRRQDTGRSGNPPFAMDIVYFHTDFARAGFEGDLNENLRLEVHANYTGVSHRMNNYELRPAPAVAMTRQSDTYADTMTADASLRFGSADRHIRVGADFELIDKGYRLYNPLSPAFFIHPLDRASSDRVGGFVEWRSGFGAIESELGLRIDRHGASTGSSRFGPGVPAGPVNLANAFALADRNWSGTSVDASLRLWAEMDACTPRLTLAHKTRAPSLIERYSWLPTEASGGLADGNIYVGDVNLRIEKAWIAELGVDWQNDNAYARPVVYYRRINDFIQGVPFDVTPGILDTPVEIVSNGSGDPTPLRFANTDTRIWGADIAFGAKIAGPLRLDGVASYVRAERTDIADNLYRMAPANGRLAVSWEESRWSIAVEGRFIARQNHVAATNSEVPSAGYILANISGYWLIREGVRLDLGIENLFDTYYLDHLAGYNRITGSDVPLGSRLPGAGRTAFVRIRWAM
jgi:iron complex outermembrane receptor protein